MDFVSKKNLKYAIIYILYNYHFGFGSVMTSKQDKKNMIGYNQFES
jgi:hypothetical protein